MITPHRATPGQWANIEQHSAEIDCYSTILELRDRLAAAEQQLAALADDATHTSQSTHFCFEAIIQRLEKLEQAARLEQSRSQAPAPAELLVEVVGKVLCTVSGCGDTPLYWAPEARAAIRACADWLEAHEVGVGCVSARWLREEVKR